MSYNISKIRGRWYVTYLLPNQPADTWVLVRSKGFATENAAEEHALKKIAHFA